MKSNSKTLWVVTCRMAFVLVMLGLSLLGSSGKAQNYTMSYQGTLTQHDAPVSDGLHQLTVTLYSDPLGNEALWTDSYATEVKNGIFNIYLGSGKSLPDSKTLDRSLWVGVSVNGTAEMRPMTKLGAVPLALNVVDQAITMDKLSPEVIGALTNQNPQAITDPILLGGNDFTNGTAGAEWIGSKSSSTGSTEVWFKTNSQTALRFQPNSTNTPSIAGGHEHNRIANSSLGAVIAGGGFGSNPNAIMRLETVLTPTIP